MSDKEIKGYWQPIKSPDGMFFCEACLWDMPLSERSQRDIRYCDFCQPIIEGEYQGLAERKGRPLSSYYRPITSAPLAVGGGRNMSTLKNPKIEVDIIQPSVAIRAIVKRGPKHRQLPEDLIIQLASKDMGSRAIASKLKADHDITVSYKTIQRVLSGERTQLALPISGA